MTTPSLDFLTVFSSPFLLIGHLCMSLSDFLGLTVLLISLSQFLSCGYNVCVSRDSLGLGLDF